MIKFKTVKEIVRASSKEKIQEPNIKGLTDTVEPSTYDHSRFNKTPQRSVESSRISNNTQPSKQPGVNPSSRTPQRERTPSPMGSYGSPNSHKFSRKNSSAKKISPSKSLTQVTTVVVNKQDPAPALSWSLPLPLPGPRMISILSRIFVRRLIHPFVVLKNLPPAFLKTPTTFIPATHGSTHQISTSRGHLQASPPKKQLSTSASKTNHQSSKESTVNLANRTSHRIEVKARLLSRILQSIITESKSRTLSDAWSSITAPPALHHTTSLQKPVPPPAQNLLPLQQPTPSKRPLPDPKPRPTPSLPSKDPPPLTKRPLIPATATANPASSLGSRTVSSAVGGVIGVKKSPSPVPSSKAGVGAGRVVDAKASKSDKSGVKAKGKMDDAEEIPERNREVPRPSPSPTPQRDTSLPPKPKTPNLPTPTKPKPPLAPSDTQLPSTASLTLLARYQKSKELRTKALVFSAMLGEIVDAHSKPQNFRLGRVLTAWKSAPKDEKQKSVSEDQNDSASVALDPEYMALAIEWNQIKLLGKAWRSWTGN